MNIDEFVSRFSKPSDPVAFSVIISCLNSMAESIYRYRKSAEHGDPYHIQKKYRCELAIRYARLDRSVVYSDSRLNSNVLSLRDSIYAARHAENRESLIQHVKMALFVVKMSYLLSGDTDKLFIDSLTLAGKIEK